MVAVRTTSSCSHDCLDAARWAGGWNLRHVRLRLKSYKINSCEGYGLIVIAHSLDPGTLLLGCAGCHDKYWSFAIDRRRI